MPKTFFTIASLMRLNAPVAYLLVFFPALFGIFLAYEKPSNLLLIPIFFIGSILMRSAGCIINDYFDQEFDRQVERTKNRPLASKAISKKLAISVLLVLLSGAFCVLITLNRTSIIIGIIGFFMVILYPLMKRFTHFPQAFLGLTFKLGCLIGYASIKDSISISALLMYFACAFWILGYDTIYAFMDIKDDKKIGVKSLAIFLEHRSYKLFLTIFYSLFILFYVGANLLSSNIEGAIGGVFSAFFLLWQIKTLDITDGLNCLIRFKSNVYVGAIMSISMLLGCIA